MALKAYEEFAEPPLAFPIGGKVYTVPPLGFRDGIRLQGIVTGADTSLNDAPPAEGYKLILGAAWDEMVADNVSLEAINRAGLTAFTDFQFGRDAAERVWEAKISPEALAAAVAATQTTPTSTPLSSTAAVAKTRTRASSSGTRTSPTKSKAKAKVSLS
jgi:hypothetical protein